MLNIIQRQSLQQKLSPQQIQYIKLLQLTSLALDQRIKDEMEVNPLLEEGDDEEEVQVVDTSDKTEKSTDEDNPETKEDDWDWDQFLNNADDLYGHKARVDQSDDDRPEMPAPYLPSMTEHLEAQLSFISLDETQQVIAQQIVGSIEEDGRLRRPTESIIDDIMFSLGIMLTEDDVEKVLSEIQRLDPVGIGARGLRECLLIQLKVMPVEIDGRENAIRMITDCYKDFSMKHFDHIKRKLGIDNVELKEAFDLVRRLDPKPGEGNFSASQNYIIPDFTVDFVDEEFIITLNGKNSPQLRISKKYRQMWDNLATAKKKPAPKPKVQPAGGTGEVKQFLKNKMEAARWFINSINQRRQTMLKIMDAIVEIQSQFFKFGEGSLKPMILKDVAELILMDISTVSRVVNGKYVQTEFGVYELKYFFSEGLTTESGEEVSNKEVKAIISGIIQEEDKKRPLSDQRIATMLEAEGFKIARRTVTKYREQLGIPVARLRKEIMI